MMTEEEKEALEWLERLVKINKRDNLFNTFAEILLNMIQKQQKEIEELNKSDTSKEQSSMNYYNLWREEKEKNKSLLDSLTRRIEYTNELEAVKLRLTIENNKLCNKQKEMEDKIKAKIEEWDMKDLTICYGGRSQGRTFQQVVRTEVKKVLQSLLEKE